MSSVLSIWSSRNNLLCAAITLTILIFCGRSGAELFELHVKNPMLVTSLRNFVSNSELYISSARNGSVILHAGEGFGIMAVVQKMNLVEQSSEFLKSTCFDYLMLSELNGTRSTEEICGYSEAKTFVRPSFVDKKGETVLTYVLQEKMRLSPFEGNYTNFNISFTPFRECPDDAFPFGNADFQPCSTVDSFSCIPTEYFCDGVVNCGFPDELGLDEAYCGKPKVKRPILSKSKPNLSKSEDLAEESTYFKNKLGKGPYKPYLSDLPSESEETTNRSISSYLAIRLSKGSNLALGVFGLIVFVVAVAGQSMRKDKANVWNGNPLPQTEKSNGSGNTNLSSVEYDEEADPVPSYDDCLASPLILPTLDVESEKPPSYQEIHTHTIGKE